MNYSTPLTTPHPHLLRSHHTYMQDRVIVSDCENPAYVYIGIGICEKKLRNCRKHSSIMHIQIYTVQATRRKKMCQLVSMLITIVSILIFLLFHFAASVYSSMLMIMGIETEIGYPRAHASHIANNEKQCE